MRLIPLPVSFPATVAALHRVAEEVVAPARKPENEIALYATPGGFGTPVFEYGGARQQVRVDGAELVHTVGDEERRAALTSLESARALVADLVPEPLSAEPLTVDAAAARVLGDWYGFGDAVLNAFSDATATEVRLWPEHFDIAIEMREVNYGFSPGDGDHDEPYAYVGPWTAEVSGDLWNAKGFRGAELSYGELLRASDPLAAALEFFTLRKDALG
ncbi:hypothetical protein [Solirubrobacter soli]|uniref:hypothetical protein n=1 Tax=Solirubrobacter soli TaxID=363832 RepID=UPI00047FB1DB|nr:hypothetical protein [Solirubrobacter soli]